jgi:hypothetical protein
VSTQHAEACATTKKLTDQDGGQAHHDGTAVRGHIAEARGWQASNEDRE